LANNPSQENTLEKLFGLLRKYWNILAGVAAWILSLVGTFLQPPFVTSGPDEQNPWANLARFVVTGLIGLMVIPLLRYRSKGDTDLWRRNAFIALFGGIVAIGLYFYSYDSWTCKCFGQAIVIGSDYTSHGQEYAAKHPNKSCSDLLEDHQCKAEDVWTKDSIRRYYQILGWTYITTIWLLTIFVIACLQAVYCAYRK